jgi:endonuclease/exonuclease/phosphatase family metal-dependent hydrolase
MEEYYIAWWNLENLFNEHDVNEIENRGRTDEEKRTNPFPIRSEWLQSQLKNELKGWTADVLAQKLLNLTSIISLKNGGKGPDLLGVCEVEDITVLQRLVSAMSHLNKNYAIALHEGEDKRGVDTAIIYDRDKFTAIEQFTHRVVKRNATRDIFQVNFQTMLGKDFVVICNHWPARMPSTYESEPYRIIAGETVSYWTKRITEIKGSDVAIIIMGDFNDDPFSRSLTDYALSTNSKRKVLNSRTSPRLFNLMAIETGKGVGSIYHSGPHLFDQILVSKGMIKSTSVLKVKDGSAKVESFTEMASGSYKSPKRFGRPSRKSSFNKKGYSDHFPISVVIQEK